MGSTLGYTPTPGLPSIYHNDGSASSTTKSAVEEGTLIVRDSDKQTQDTNDLSRDTENANNPLGQIFDKQKEQDRMDAIDLVKDIAAQAKDVAQKYSKIKAEETYNSLSTTEKAAKDAEAIKALEQQGLEVNPDSIKNQVINQIVQKDGVGNMGDAFIKGLDAASSIITGIITGDLTGGLAGASAPYLAEQIKLQTGHQDPITGEWKTDNTEANLIAHAILGGAVAAAQGNSALAGSTGALTGEAAAGYIKDLLYGEGTNIADLTQEQKENISNLAQIASGLAVAAGGGSVSDVGTSVAGSKNAVENNFLAPAIKQAAQIGARAYISNNVCRVEVTKQLIYAAATIGITLEVSDIDPDKLQAIIDKVGNQVDLASGVSGIASSVIQNAINDVFSDDSSNNQDNNHPLSDSGGSTAAGSPSPLPPDDDDNKKQETKKSNADDLKEVSQKQLDKKFKHAEDFGIDSTKKNPETLKQFENAIREHMSDTSTTEYGTYANQSGSRVYLNSKTNNVVIVDKNGNFITGFNLKPGSTQYINYIKNGFLR